MIWDWIPDVIAAAGAVFSAASAIVAKGHSQSAKDTVAQITPTINAALAAAPPAVAAVQAATTTADKIATTLDNVAAVIAPAQPEALPIAGLIDVFAKLADAIMAHGQAQITAAQISKPQPMLFTAPQVGGVPQ